MLFWPKQTISRVLSPAAGCPTETGNGHSSRTAVACRLKQSTRKHGRAVLEASLFDLAPGGVYRAPGVTAGSGELLPHPFTLTCLRRSLGRRSSLCGTFPGVSPAGRYPAPCPEEPGLSSPRLTGSDHLVCFDQSLFSLLHHPAGAEIIAFGNVDR